MVIGTREDQHAEAADDAACCRPRHKLDPQVAGERRCAGAVACVERVRRDEFDRVVKVDEPHRQPRGRRKDARDVCRDREAVEDERGAMERVRGKPALRANDGQGEQDGEHVERGGLTREDDCGHLERALRDGLNEGLH